MTFKNAIIFSLHTEAKDTITQIITILEANHIQYHIESKTAARLNMTDYPIMSMSQLDTDIDVAVVVGGDGSMLTAACMFSIKDIPLIGINRGRLGFLVTLDPNKEKELMDIFKGEYIKESRMLLEVTAKDKTYFAFNDCIVTRRETGRLVEIELYLDKKYMCSYRADGFLISTPTGSTAHAMSAGGPIIYPTMDAMLLLPICPHKLSSRPIIIPQNGMLSIKVCDSNRVLPIIGCDGQDKDVLSPGDMVHIKASTHKVHLMHGKTYDYYENLRKKLNWEEPFYQC